MSKPSHPFNILITGANRGIGLQLTRQTLADGNSVWATARNPSKATELQKLKELNGSKLNIYELEVSEEESVKKLFNQIKSENVEFDVILSNAGIFHRGDDKISDFNLENLVESLKVNTFGPIYVSREFLPIVKKNGQFVGISSFLGSIALNDKNTYGGNFYSYRVSKAALNQSFKNWSNELNETEQQAYVIHPGSVKTDMNPHGTITTEESASSILKIIYSSTKENNGKFFNTDERMGLEISFDVLG